MAIRLTGKEVAQSLNADSRARIAALEARGLRPQLALLRVGERGDDLAYEQSILKRAAALGVKTCTYVFPETVATEELLEAVEVLNRDRATHGVLLFRPLPRHLDEERVCEALNPAKDVDGVTRASMAALYAGRPGAFAPCTAQACLELLDHYQIDVAGKRVLVLGRSLVIGRPVAMLLLQRHATPTLCHTRSVTMKEDCRRADIIIAAAGRAGLVGPDFLSPGQTVIDVGINFDAEGKMCGDLAAAAAEDIVRAYSPVPGGVGTVTGAVLMRQVVAAAERSVAGAEEKEKTAARG